MALAILSVAFPFAPVGPDAVGGAEQVVTAMDEALAAHGHRSIVLGAAGSVVRGELVALPPLPAPRDEHDWELASAQVRGALDHVLAHQHIDAVHVHAFGFERFLPPPGPPVLVTLHLPLSWYPAHALAPDRPGLVFNCVSRAQQRSAPHMAAAPVIPNGVAAERFLYRPNKRRFALAMGRICPEKGFHLAIAAAATARTPLVLAGRVFSYRAHEAYFHERIAPALGVGCRFIGPAGFDRKRRLLAAAGCVLVPSLAPETTSLVALEAMASGTPVVAFRAGALTEVVESGHTGFLVDSVEEMAVAIEEARALDPESCRRRVEERFPLAETVRRYLNLYERLRDADLSMAATA